MPTFYVRPLSLLHSLNVFDQMTLWLWVMSFSLAHFLSAAISTSALHTGLPGLPFPPLDCSTWGGRGDKQTRLNKATSVS